MKQQNKTLLLLATLLITTFEMVNAQEVSRTIMQPMKVIYVSDTVNTNDNISAKMGKDYGILFMAIGMHKLKPGKLMAIYHTAATPWIFDVAVEVDRFDNENTGVTKFKSTDSGDAVVVHFKDPYEELNKAYLQIETWLKKNRKQKAGSPMEVYLNSPSAVKDKSELLTDVYQLIK